MPTYGNCFVCNCEKPLMDRYWIANEFDVAGVCENCLSHARDYHQLEAQVAAMREALNHIFKELCCICDNELFVCKEPVDCENFKLYQQALSADAGRAYVERMKKLELLVRQQVKFLENTIPLAGSEREWLKEARNTLDGDSK